MSYLLHHQLINTSVKNPSKVAIKCRQKSLSYSELDKFSGSISFALHEIGCKPKDRVGIIMKKDVEYITCLLGILKLGAVYVPIDPHWPIKRINRILRNCGVEIVITDQITNNMLGLENNLESEITIISLQEKEMIVSERSEIDYKVWAFEEIDKTQNLYDEITDSDLAYIIHTSGSTGHPKGVAISHKAVLDWVKWGADTAELMEDDNIANDVPFFFDISAFDIFVTQHVGATLHIIPEDFSRFPANYPNFLMNNEISFFYWVPSRMIQVLKNGGLNNHSYPNVKTIFFAGEPFPVKHLRDWMEIIPNANFYNLYGSTEAPACSYYFIEKISDGEHVPIGKPCANMELIALNENKKPIRPGEIGELIVRGSMVMQGYWNQWEQTRQVIKQNPQNSSICDLVYYTNDLVTVDEEENYQFVRRKNSQIIKSGGRLIDLGEIENVILKNGKVQQAIVLSHEDNETKKRIVAFIVLEEEVQIREIIKQCRSYLPKYMIPEEIKILDSFPTTSTGKLDKTKLQNYFL